MNVNAISSTVVYNISGEQLMNLFEKLHSEIEELKRKVNSKPNEQLLTREETANFFKCDLSTIHNWTKKGDLLSHSVNGRVYYKMSDVESALIPIRTKTKK
jgi:hypothetical protein